MRLVDDERGRVPFALIGVLLLVSSVAIATVQLDGNRVDRDAALAGDRAEATLETTLRDAVRDAGAQAASNPVVTPTNTTYGEVLDPDRPYRSYLELLVAIELRERLGETGRQVSGTGEQIDGTEQQADGAGIREGGTGQRTDGTGMWVNGTERRADGVGQRVDDATAIVELPPIDDPAAAEAAIERVHVESAGRGLVRATVTEVPIVLRQDGSEVSRRDGSISVNVTTPALTLHERTAEFQSRLDGDTLEPGTLNRGLTGSLWSLAWARGYGQYAGIPFENVIANDHVELVTNLAALDVQRSVFGRADEEGENRLAERTAQVVSDEGIGMASGAFEAAALPTNASEAIDAPTVDSPDPETRTVGVNETADLALADVIEVASPEIVAPRNVDHRSPDPVGTSDRVVTYEDEIVPEGVDPWVYSQRAIVRTAASIDARLLTTRRAGEATRVSTEPSPRPGWDRGTIVDEGEPSVEGVREGRVAVPDVSEGWSTHHETELVVVLERTDVVRYVNASSSETERVRERYRREVDVGLALAARPVQRDWIPDAGGAERGDVHDALLERSAERLLGDRGGTSGVAERVATGGPIDAEDTVSPADIGPLADAAYGDVVGLREEVRDVSTAASTAHVLTDGESPHAELESTVRDRSERYRAVPTRYDGLGNRATVALRGVYVDRVLRRLDARSSGSGGAREDISSAVSDTTELPGVGLSDFFEVGMDYSRPEPTPIEARDPAPDLELAVDGDPSYLSTDVERDTRVRPPDDPYHPMGARMTTISSLPTDEITGRISEAIASVFGREDEETAPLPVAARSLQSSEQLDEREVAAEGLGDPQEDLRWDVEEELRDLEAQVAGTLADETELDDGDAEAVVAEALAPYDRPGGTILAFDDGSASARIAAIAAEQHDDVDATDADRARTLVRADVDEYLAEDDSQVTLNKVESVSEPTRDVIEGSVGRAVEHANERGEEVVRERILDQTPFSMLPTRGFPVAPVPQWWLVTANVWHVEVHGTYASFAVRADQGGPSGGSHVSYVRDGQPVDVDVDGDGTPERIGRSDRISFTATTTVTVAVPRGGGGVGNNGTGFLATTAGWDPPGSGPDRCGPPGGSVHFPRPGECPRERPGQ